MAELQRDLRRGRPVCAGRLLLWIVALLLAAQTAHAQGAPLFTFVQISDSQPVVAADQAIFEEVLDTVIAGGQSGALLPRAVDFVIIPGDLVDLASNTSEWVSFVDTVDTRLTAVGIPYLAVPGNHDIQGHGVGNYELYIADSGVWDSGIDVVAGHNGEVVALGWEGLRFIGFNSYNTGANEVSSADLAIIDQRVTDAGAASENAFLVAHYPHDGSSRMPLASILPDPNIVGYMRGHTNNAHAFSGLDGVSNPNAWDLNSNAIYRDGAILYYEVFANELQVHVIELLPSPPSSLPPPVTVPLVHTLRSVGPPVAPTADFSASPQSGAAPLEVTFIDQSLDSPTSWLWDFGDGNGSSEQHPVHTYTVAGTYDVSLTVTNSAGSDTLTDVALISVSPPLPMTTYTPVADAHVKDSSPSNNYGGLDHVRVRGGAPDYEGYLKFDVAGLASSAVQSATLRLYVNDASPDGGTLYEAASTSWTESGITWNSAPGPTGAPLASMGETMVGSWAEFDVSALVTGDGTYAFMLDSGSTNSSYYSSREGTNAPELVVLSAAAEAPVADFSGTPVAGTAPLTVDFSDLSSGPPESWSWSFGDGGTSTEASPSHTYDAAGVYTVTLTVSNGLGSDTRTRTSYVSVDPPVSPVADFSADVTSGSAPLDVVFTDLSTGNPASWAWDFGDGNGSSEPNPSHRYAAAGTYDVSLTVTNPADSDTLTRVGYVSVAPPPPVTTHLAVADAHVRDSSPTKNYGSVDHLRGRGGSPTYRGHVQFDVTGLAGASVESATLRLFVTDGSVDGGTFYEAASTGWSETGITWNNAPAPSGAALGSAGSVNVGTWVEIDVTPAVEGDGLHAFVFTSGSTNSVYYASRETANPPELVIESAAAAPPVADFSGTPVAGTAPLTVDFSDLSSGPPESWSWTFGDGGTSTEANPSHTYDAAGVYTVTLTVSNGLGSDTRTRTSYVSVDPPVSPVADFSADVTSGSAPLDVVFTDLSTGNPASWAWDFGDGNGSSEPNPSHRYAAAGTYDVSLTVTNSADSDTLTRVGYVSVAPPPPVTTHLPVADAHVRDSSPNNNYGSLDHLRGRAGTSSYRGHLQFDVTGLAGSSVESATLRLFVTDGSVDGGTFYEAASTGWSESGITWNNAPAPSGAALGSAGSVNVGSWVEIDVTPAVEGDGLHAFLFTSGSSNSVYYASRETANPPELVIEAAAAAPPVAGFSATPLTGTAPLTVDFSDLSSGPPTSWLWTFGDGNTSTEANPSHTYAAAGPYDVTLTVTNGLGADTLSRTGYVSVSPPVPPTADFSADVTSGTTPLDVQFSDLSTGNPASWLWDFGDGNGSSDPNPSHTYAGAGTYDVSLTVTNPADSDTLTRVGYISVSLPPPVTTHFPVADAHVRDKNANRNYGGEDHLRLRGGSPNYQAYLKFDVSGSGGSVASAVLRLYVTDASVDGGTVYEAASTSWTESGINWNNAPGSVGAPLASAGPVAVDTWVEYDVTGLVTGDGTWALLVTSDSTNSTFFSSREGAQSPELVIESN